tara:strand:- start:1056 stop:1241 length:186 start_codon:yes stop_codon:yes gene_type:complete
MINLTVKFRNKEAMEEWITMQNELMNLSIDMGRVDLDYRQYDSIDKKNEKENYVLIRKEGE